MPPRVTNRTLRTGQGLHRSAYPLDRGSAIGLKTPAIPYIYATGCKRVSERDCLKMGSLASVPVL
jgi:hypothetical protein